MPDSIAKIVTVAWRDFKHTALTKAFLFAIIGVPLLIVVGGGLSVVIMESHEEPPLEGTIAIVDPGGDLTPAVAKVFARDKKSKPVEAMSAQDILGASPTAMPGLARGEIRVDVERVDNDTETIPEDIRTRVRDGDLLAAVQVPDALINPPPLGESPSGRFDLVVGPDVDSDHVGMIERRIGDAVIRVRARRAGQDPDRTIALLRRPSAQTGRLMPDGQETDENELTRAAKLFIIPMAFMMLLWVSTVTSAQQLLMSTIEEKSNKVMEVLLSAVSPLQLMTGKIIGQGLVGLIMVGVYSSLGIAGLIAAAQLDLIEPWQLVGFAVYFFMAYFMVASMMAAVGSAVSDIREANSLLMPLMLLLTIPLMLWMPISQSPNGLIATVFSFLPPATPFVMVLRNAAEEPLPAWQLPATMLWGWVCVVGMVWMASRIFRVGVLMQGKPPSPIELLRWLRRA